MGSLSRSNLSSTESAVCDHWVLFHRQGSQFVLCFLWTLRHSLTSHSLVSYSELIRHFLLGLWGRSAAGRGCRETPPPPAPTSHVLFGKGFHFNWNELVFCEYLLYFYYFIFIYCFEEAINYEDSVVKALVCKNWYSSFSISFILNM